MTLGSNRGSKQTNPRTFLVNKSKVRNKVVVERFLDGLVGLVKVHGKHHVPTDLGTWYPMACKFLKLNHHIHSPFEKSLIERTMQYIKDRTEGFDDYFPCRMKNCKLNHVRRWLNLFVNYHNEKKIHP